MGIMSMFTIFSVVMVSRVSNMSKLKLYTLNRHSLSHVNYISIKLILKKIQGYITSSFIKTCVLKMEKKAQNEGPKKPKKSSRMDSAIQELFLMHSGGKNHPIKQPVSSGVLGYTFDTDRSSTSQTPLAWITDLA